MTTNEMDEVADACLAAFEAAKSRMETLSTRMVAWIESGKISDAQREKMSASLRSGNQKKADAT